MYACPFAIHENFLAGNVRDAGGFEGVWKTSALFADLRKPDTGGACKSCGFYDSCRGGCMAAKFFTGLPLDGPDPECVQGYGETALASVPPRRRGRCRARRSTTRTAPHPCAGPRGGRRGGPVPVTIAAAARRRTTATRARSRASTAAEEAGVRPGCTGARSRR